jgi:hypothetical protein
VAEVIGLLLDQLLDAAYGAVATFAMSAKRERAWHAARHPDRAVYAPPLTRQHAPWPHEQWPGDDRRPYQPWPGDRR